MMPTITTRALRGPALAAIAAVGVLGLAACGGGDDEQPTTSATSGAGESAAPSATETAAPSDAAGASTCTNEQIATLVSASGTTVPEQAYAAATADFTPAEVLGTLPTTCVFAVSEAGIDVSFAVLPGGAATLSTVAQQATAAGGSVTDAGGTITGSVGEATVVGAPFAQFTQETAGFESVDDLVVVVSTTALG